MVSLKMSKAESAAESAAGKPPEYPWGTRLTLVDEVAHAIFPEMPKVGAEMKIVGTAMVASVNIVQQQGGKTRVSVDLQITDIDAAAAKAKATPNWYGDKPKD
jgi:hypothetical protein